METVGQPTWRIPNLAQVRLRLMFKWKWTKFTALAALFQIHQLAPLYLSFCFSLLPSLYSVLCMGSLQPTLFCDDHGHVHVSFHFSFRSLFLEVRSGFGLHVWAVILDLGLGGGVLFLEIRILG